MLVIIDDKLSDEVVKSYSKGKWNKYGTNPKLPIGDPKKETILYLRKFMTAVNMRFESQFTSPKINLHISGVIIGKNLPFSRTPRDDEDAMDVYLTLDKMVIIFLMKRLEMIIILTLFFSLLEKTNFARKVVRIKANIKGYHSKKGLVMIYPSTGVLT